MKEENKFDRLKGYQNTKKINAFAWWNRLGQPNKKDMMKRCKKGDMENIDVTPEDVELLPWLVGGLSVDVIKMKELMLEASTFASPNCERRKVRRNRTCYRQIFESCKLTQALDGADLTESTEDITESTHSAEWADLDFSDWEIMDGKKIVDKIDHTVQSSIVQDDKTQSSRHSRRSRNRISLVDQIDDTAHSSIFQDDKTLNSRISRRSNKIHKENTKIGEEEECRIAAYQDSRILNAYNWWSRLGHPSKKVMIKRCGRGSMENVDLTPDDVELLPWLEGGFVLDEPKMLKFVTEVEFPSSKSGRKEHKSDTKRRNSPKSASPKNSRRNSVERSSRRKMNPARNERSPKAKREGVKRDTRSMLEQQFSALDMTLTEGSNARKSVSLHPDTVESLQEGITDFLKMSRHS